ncbi:MAG: type II toxin-antitoxin system RelE/ParE family toxin [Chloroflexi bacterium]|nr:type II toxin-antitoxin system RelE/ParE family toxin [Chloroflexota bacterium]
MEISFSNNNMQHLNHDPFCQTDLPQSVVKMFRRRVAQIGAALDEADMAALTGLDFKTEGTEPGCYSMCLSGRYRLHFQIDTRGCEKFAVIYSVTAL